MYPRLHVGTRSHQGTAGLSQVLAGDNGRDGDHLGRLAHFNSEDRGSTFVVPRSYRRGTAWRRHFSSASPSRAPHRPDREAIAMEILAGIIMLAVVLLFVGIALDAAYHK